MTDLEDLAEALGVDSEALYNELREKAFYEIETRDLPIMRILRDLMEIRKSNPRHADLITDATAYPFSSYEELGDRNSMSKQAVLKNLQRYARDYTWINGIIKIRTDQNMRGIPPPESRHGNRKSNENSYQLSLFYDE